MSAAYQKPSRWIWLMLLMVALSGANTASLAESQQIEIKLESRPAPDPSDGNNGGSTREQALTANILRQFSRRGFPESPVLATGSDAYTSLTLHGPPAGTTSV